MTHICPHCGFDLVQDAVITLGRYRYDPRIGLFIDGRRLRLTRQGLEIAAMLFRAQGRVLSLGVLAERLGSSSHHFGNTLAVHMHRLRFAWADMGAPFPIKRVRGIGLYWGGAPFECESAGELQP